MFYVVDPNPAGVAFCASQSQWSLSSGCGTTTPSGPPRPNPPGFWARKSIPEILIVVEQLIGLEEDARATLQTMSVGAIP